MCFILLLALSFAISTTWRHDIDMARYLAWDVCGWHIVVTTMWDSSPDSNYIMLRTQGLKLVGKPCIQTVQNDAKSSKALQHSRQAYEILNKQRHLSLWSENDQVDSVWISQKKIYQNNTVTVFSLLTHSNLPSEQLPALRGLFLRHSIHRSNCHLAPNLRL
jgi:hypothetical protein